ncbi:hypothetical protein WJX73_009254 [Symbiochloris irregularis]|uniref:Uncharacterized protein n=1 Tax=Symbiochloris irregularis TaxID=706552 RepID=A0AAW1PLS0_9CHLO
MEVKNCYTCTSSLWAPLCDSASSSDTRTGLNEVLMSSSLEAVKEDLKEVENLLNSAQDPARRERLQERRLDLRAELRRLEENSGQHLGVSLDQVLRESAGWTCVEVKRQSSSGADVDQLAICSAITAGLDERVEPDPAKDYLSLVAEHIPTEGVPCDFRLEAHDVRGEVVRLHAKGAPFPISGKNDILLVPRKWHLQPVEYAVAGIEMKKGLRQEQLKQAKIEFLLGASHSNLPFCQCVTDLEHGGFALYQTAHYEGKHIVQIRLLKGMESFWTFLETLCKQLVNAVPDSFPHTGDLPELPGPKRMKLTLSHHIVPDSPCTIGELIAAVYHPDVANLDDLACFDDAKYQALPEPPMSPSALSMNA